MRWLVLGIIGAALVVNGQEAKPHSDTHKKTPPPKAQGATHTAARTVIVVNQDAPQGEKDNHPGKSPSYLSKLFGPENIPNIALVVVGIGGIIAALCTLRLISWQTRVMVMQTKIAKTSARAAIFGVAAAKKSADAALLNAQAIINSERAWLIPTTESIEPNDLPTRFLANSQVETMTVRIENCGRTPAWLMDWFFEAVVLDDTNIGQFTHAVRPEGDFPNARPFPQGRTEPFSFEWTTNQSEIANVKAGKKHLYIYGFLQYRSILGNAPCVSYVCFHCFHRRDTRGKLRGGWAMEQPKTNHYT